MAGDRGARGAPRGASYHGLSSQVSTPAASPATESTPSPRPEEQLRLRRVPRQAEHVRDGELGRGMSDERERLLGSLGEAVDERDEAMVEPNLGQVGVHALLGAQEQVAPPPIGLECRSVEIAFLYRRMDSRSSSWVYSGLRAIENKPHGIRCMVGSHPPFHH